MQGAGVPSLVRELKSHKLSRQKEKNNMFIWGPVQQQQQGSGLALLLSSRPSPLGHIMAAAAPGITSSASKGSVRTAVPSLTSSLPWEAQHSQKHPSSPYDRKQKPHHLSNTGHVPTPSTGPSSGRSRTLHQGLKAPGSAGRNQVGGFQAESLSWEG